MNQSPNNLPESLNATFSARSCGGGWALRSDIAVYATSGCDLLA